MKWFLRFRLVLSLRKVEKRLLRSRIFLGNVELKENKLFNWSLFKAFDFWVLVDIFKLGKRCCEAKHSWKHRAWWSFFEAFGSWLQIIFLKEIPEVYCCQSFLTSQKNLQMNPFLTLNFKAFEQSLHVFKAFNNQKLAHNPRKFVSSWLLGNLTSRTSVWKLQ